MRNNFVLASVIIGASIILATYIFTSNHNTQPKVTTTKKFDLCTRKIPYNNPPEFVRAVSLINQRALQSVMKTDYYSSIINCLDIQYGDLSKEDAEGYFIFDPNSSMNDLKILVSNKYKNYDDILTAVLLSHELRHVQQFIDYKTNGKELSCLDKEVEAFKWQFGFITWLNLEEQKSVYNRISINPNENNAYAGLWALMTIFYNPNIPGEEVVPRITKLVHDNPFYQKECNNN